jgi:hypothetical protein
MDDLSYYQRAAFAELENGLVGHQIQFGAIKIWSDKIETAVTMCPAALGNALIYRTQVSSGVIPCEVLEYALPARATHCFALRRVFQ